MRAINSWGSSVSGRLNARRVLSFNPKPEAMAGVTCGECIPLSAIASGFGLNEGPPKLYCRFGRRSISFSVECSIMSLNRIVANESP